MTNKFSGIEFLVWLSLGLVSVLIFSFELNRYLYSIIYTGIIIMIHSTFYYTKHGGKFITPTGMYLLYSALLYGVGSIYINFVPDYTIVFGHYIGVLLAYSVQVFVYHFYLRENGLEKYYDINFMQSNTENSTLRFSLLFFLVLSLTVRVIPPLFFLEEHVVYIGIIFFTSAIIFNNYQIKLNHIVRILILFFIYYNFYFDGFGRINLATLVLVIVAIVQFRKKIRSFKIITVLLFFPSIIMASLLRGGTMDDLGGGIGSLISPFYRFGELIQMRIDGTLDLAYGQTIYAALVVFIPRSIWASKPWNFNRQITEIFMPEYVAYGHSEASVFIAEMVFNFGLLFGFIFSIVILGILVSKIEQKLIHIINYSRLSLDDIIDFIIIMIIASGLLNLLWGGFSTFINRDGFKLVIIVGFLYAIKIFNKQTQK